MNTEAFACRRNSVKISAGQKAWRSLERHLQINADNAAILGSRQGLNLVLLVQVLHHILSECVQGALPVQHFLSHALC